MHSYAEEFLRPTVAAENPTVVDQADGKLDSRFFGAMVTNLASVPHSNVPQKASSFHSMPSAPQFTTASQFPSQFTSGSQFPSQFNSGSHFTSGPQFNAASQFTSAPQFTSPPQFTAAPQYNTAPQFNAVPQFTPAAQFTPPPQFNASSQLSSSHFTPTPNFAPTPFTRSHFASAPQFGSGSFVANPSQFTPSFQNAHGGSVSRSVVAASPNYRNMTSYQGEYFRPTVTAGTMSEAQVLDAADGRVDNRFFGAQVVTR